jgi:DNA-binding NarL/FixJ family response regulator
MVGLPLRRIIVGTSALTTVDAMRELSEDCSLGAGSLRSAFSFAPKEPILLRIFLVDDNAMARSAIKAALQQHSEWVVVGEASSGRQALDSFRRHQPQITVMDFKMPEMNGLEAARRLTERDPDVRILMITTDPTSELEEEAKRAGIKGLCPKDEMHCLENAIDALVSGGTYFSEEAAA